MLSSRRVVVTGLGIVSPVGSKINVAWSNIKAGKSGIAKINPNIFDTEPFSVKIAGNVSDFVADDYVSAKEQKKNG